LWFNFVHKFQEANMESYKYWNEYVTVNLLAIPLLVP